MSYHSSYIIFDTNKASSKLKIEKEITTDKKFELLSEYIDAGTVFSYTPEDNNYVFGSLLPELASLHNIEYADYLTEDQITQLLSVLDNRKVNSLLPDSKQAKIEATVEMDTFIQAVRDGLETGVFDKEDIDISAWQRYAVPLFQAHGITIYTKLSKQNAEELIKKLNDADTYTAVSKATYLDVLGKQEQEIIVDTLQNLKAIHQKLKESHDFKLLFYDDLEQEFLPKNRIDQLIEYQENIG